MAGVLYCSKSKSKEWLGFSFTENVAITYCSGLVLLKTLKKRYDWSFNLFKMLKYGTVQ